MKLLCIFQTSAGEIYVCSTRGPNIARQELATLIGREVFLVGCRLTPTGISAQNIVKRLAEAFPSATAPVGVRLYADIDKLSWEVTKICLLEPRLQRMEIVLRRAARQFLRKLITFP